MNDLLYFFGGILGILGIALTIYYIDKLSGCWHKWGLWEAGETYDAYVQYRRCSKCGYVEREQWRKIQSKHD